MSPEMAALLAACGDVDAYPVAAGTAYAETMAAGVAAYDAAMAAGHGRYVAREHAAATAAQADGLTWSALDHRDRAAYRGRFSTRPAYGIDGPAPVLGGRVYVEHPGTNPGQPRRY